MLEAGKELVVFSIRPGRNGSVWVRAGRARVQEDGTMTMDLDVLPLDGKLHVREVPEPRPARLPH